MDEDKVSAAHACAVASSAQARVTFSMVMLFLFCLVLTVHYLLVRYEVRMMRFSVPVTWSQPKPAEPKANGISQTTPQSSGALAKRPPSCTDATAPPEGQRNEETGEVFPTPETLASMVALAQRVRDLGLHLGDIVVTGVSLGLPNGETGAPVFGPGNVEALMEGKNLIGKLPPAAIQAQLDRNVVQIHKNASGARERHPINQARQVIQLASRVCNFDLAKEFGVSAAIVETLDTTYALAVGAGLEAMRDAGLIKLKPELSAHVNSAARPAWELPEHMRDETGVIFAASFPALDSMIEELSRAMAASLHQAEATARLQFLRELHELSAGWTGEEGVGEHPPPSELSAWLEAELAKGEEAAAALAGYEYNRKLLFKLLVMANSQLAEIVKARGPNLHINAACAGTTAAISLAMDWMRCGKCRRVVVISADNPSSEHLMPWVGIGFLALGAASIKPEVGQAALPFDKRRNGMLLGAGAVGMVLQVDEGLDALPRPPLATVLCARHNNSAFHASAIGTAHACKELELLLQDVERVHGLGRREIAQSLLYVSHETFTCARNGGCAGAEMTALSAAFGEDLRKILVTNTKGMTGHAMGVCFEDVLAVTALSTGRIPPVVNHCEADPLLGPVQLSKGGAHLCKYALHFAAGFGSQVTYVLYRK
ncbi:hypothetical protein AB1Y20_021677 [Prymnesium parvum]|uniref:beta-ketoacyl-[acyl-carrier-protein] synthase I n=1 Tax=Prymnesium parvum TaxID=97485 RepID=A0AB34JM92_PRYPA